MVDLPPIPPKLQPLGRVVVRWLQDAIQLIAQSDTTLGAHTALSSAHGATGAIVGNGDLATTSAYGVVRKAAASADASASTASVTSADATSAGASYNQTVANSAVTLVNEVKADVNTLAADLNAAITSLNDLKARLRTAGVLST